MIGKIVSFLQWIKTKRLPHIRLFKASLKKIDTHTHTQTHILWIFCVGCWMGGFIILHKSFMSWRAFDGKSITTNAYQENMRGRGRRKEGMSVNNNQRQIGEMAWKCFKDSRYYIRYTDWKMGKNLFDGGFWCRFEIESLNIDKKNTPISMNVDNKATIRMPIFSWNQVISCFLSLLLHPYITRFLFHSSNISTLWVV